jgi:hypothetical protein
MGNNHEQFPRRPRSRPKARHAPTMSSETLASQIVAAAQGDARLAYDFLDTLNRHVTRMLQEQKR